MGADPGEANLERSAEEDVHPTRIASPGERLEWGGSPPSFCAQSAAVAVIRACSLAGVHVSGPVAHVSLEPAPLASHVTHLYKH